MLKNMVASALFAGVCAGLSFALLQFWLVQPVLLHAEAYESGAMVHFGAEGAAAHDHSTHDHAAEGHDDAGADPMRSLLTVLFAVLGWSGFGMVLVAAMAFAARFGATLDARKGLIWGIAGFVAFQLSPAIGLAPELPGSAAAEVLPRQVWWFSTVAVTALGLGLIAFGRNWAHWALAVALIAAPHVVGPPMPEVLTGVAPPELAGEFSARVLGIGLAAWAILGLSAGHFWGRHQA